MARSERSGRSDLSCKLDRDEALRLGYEVATERWELPIDDEFRRRLPEVQLRYVSVLFPQCLRVEGSYGVGATLG